MHKWTRQQYEADNEVHPQCQVSLSKELSPSEKLRKNSVIRVDVRHTIKKLVYVVGSGISRDIARTSVSKTLLELRKKN